MVEMVAPIEETAHTIFGDHRAAMCTGNARFRRRYRCPLTVEGFDDPRDSGLAENDFEGAQEDWHVAMTTERRDLLTSIGVREAVLQAVVVVVAVATDVTVTAVVLVWADLVWTASAVL